MLVRSKYIILFLLLFILQSIQAQTPGTSGQVTWMYWDDIYRYWNFDHDLIFLHEDDTYPNGPDQTRTLNSLSTPSNYEDNYAAVTKGFISVPDSGPTTFNLTGNDYTLFLLSSDATRANLDTIAYVPDYSGFEEYNKYSSQTSGVVQLSVGQLYYFEIHHKENGNSDHAVVRWQRPFLTDSTWQLVSSPFLTDVAPSEICPPRGTSCNDGNAATFNDLEDGNCHCLGTPDTTGLHVGERGVLDVYFYDNTGNGNISELNVPNFPSIPNSMTKQRNGMNIYWDWDGQYEDYALHIQGYFTVPVTGSYDFNITGARNLEFRFNSMGSNPTTDQQMSIRWGTGRADHDHPTDPGDQTLTDVTLSAGTFYYFEFTQAITDWGHHANVFWKVPGHDDDYWHMIPKVHFYDYTNESACIPNGTSCNDSNPLTANDQITDCDCAGTPCTPMMDCDDPAADNFTYDYCDVSEQLGDRPDDAWLSCSVGNIPPVSKRSGYHWIHYDLGKEYLLKSTRVWNYNVPGQTNLGFQNVVVDYSTDGINWTQLGTYNWPLANGDNTYTGFVGPEFGNIAVRYVLITSLDGGSCRGLSKVAFTAQECQYKGEICDDGDLATVNDHFDENCNCKGYTEAELNCGADTLFINQMDLSNDNYHAMMAIMSHGTVLNSSDIDFKAGMEIILDAGFEVETGGELAVEIEDCTQNVIALSEPKTISKNLSENPKPEESLSIYTIAESSIQTIRMYLPDATEVTLEVLSIDGRLEMPIARHYYRNYGDHYKRLETRKLDSGVYLIKMTTEKREYLERMVVTKPIEISY